MDPAAEQRKNRPPATYGQSQGYLPSREFCTNVQPVSKSTNNAMNKLIQHAHQHETSSAEFNTFVPPPQEAYTSFEHSFIEQNTYNIAVIDRSLDSGLADLTRFNDSSNADALQVSHTEFTTIGPEYPTTIPFSPESSRQVPPIQRRRSAIEIDGDTQYRCRKRRRPLNTTLRGELGETSNIAIEDTSQKIPEWIINTFRLWLTEHPGIFPSLEEITGFVSVTKLAPDTIRQWFALNTLSQAAPVDNAEAILELSQGLHPEDIIHTRANRASPSLTFDIASVCSRASREYGKYRPKCIEGMSIEQRENNRCKAWDRLKQYSCTSLCGKAFRRKDEWRRHEESKCWPQKGWICNLGATWGRGAGNVCTFSNCETFNPGQDHWALVHGSAQTCRAKGGHVFLRRDHNQQHIRNTHVHLNDRREEFLDIWRFATSNNFPDRCGFCGHPFTSWHQRVDHIACEHFEKEAIMRDWRHPWISSSTALAPPADKSVEDGEGNQDQNKDANEETEVANEKEEDSNGSDEEEEDDDESDNDGDDDDDDDSDNDNDNDDDDDDGDSDNDEGDQGGESENSSHEPPSNHGADHPDYRNNFDRDGNKGGSGLSPSEIFFADSDFWNSFGWVYRFIQNSFLGECNRGSSFNGPSSSLTQHMTQYISSAQSMGNYVLLRYKFPERGWSLAEVSRSTILLGPRVGAGGMSVVRKLYLSSSQESPLVLKLSNRGPDSRREQLGLLREFHSLNILHHPHIVNSSGMLLIPNPNQLGLLMPMADCDLKVFLDNARHEIPKWRSLRSFFGCLASALAYIHESGFRHMDIKPANILVHEHTVHYTDFGISVSEFGNAPSLADHGFTDKYAAPEIAAQGSRSFECDIFALGCVFLEIMTAIMRPGCVADPSVNDPKLPYRCTLSSVYEWLSQCEPGHGFSSPHFDMIHRMLNESPLKRPSAKEVLQCFPPRKCCGKCKRRSSKRLNSRARGKVQEGKKRPSLRPIIDDEWVSMSHSDVSVLPNGANSRYPSTNPDTRTVATLTTSNVYSTTPKLKHERWMKNPELDLREYSKDVFPGIKINSPHSFKASVKKPKILSSIRISTTPFSYRPLCLETREIRLLQILPSKQSETIFCSIKHVSMLEEPAYTALSYCWGAVAPTRNIFVDGGLLSVTENLYAALRELRDRANECFWIDAICIDQSNIKERTAQVCSMGRIYELAGQVIAWLGPADRQSDTVMRYIDKIQIAKKPSPLQYIASVNKTGRAWSLNSVKVYAPDNDNALWAALNHFFQRSWWNRLWVIQEAVLAREVMILCGDKMVSWHQLISLLRALEEILGEGKNRPSRFPRYKNTPAHTVSISLRKMSVFEFFRNSETRFSLLEALERSRGYGTSDPRDRIFALMGLAKDGPQLGISPDYNKPVYEVFTEAALAIIRNTGSLDLLMITSLHGKSPEMPSWVPDWSVSTELCPTYSRIFHAAADSTAMVQIEQEARIPSLRITGTRVGRVSLVGHVWGLERQSIEDTKTSLVAVKQFLTEMEDLTRKVRILYTDEEQRAEAVWATSSAGLELAWDGSWQTTKFSYSTYQSTIQGTMVLEADAKRICATLSIRSIYRRPFIVDQDYLGLGPADVEEGDIVVVFLGVNVPFILRPVRDKYALVGDCYVHGIMHGELMMTGHIEIEEFVLS